MPTNGYQLIRYILEFLKAFFMDNLDLIKIKFE